MEAEEVKQLASILFRQQELVRFTNAITSSFLDESVKKQIKVHLRSIEAILMKESLKFNQEEKDIPEGA